MRYLVRARVKLGCEAALLKPIEDGTLGKGSVAEGEYLRNMRDARLCPDETARWAEVCLVESRVGAVAQNACRFPSPLIEPDVPLASIRLSDRFHQRAHGRSPEGVTRRWTPSGPKMT
jgi:hypothetical protein